MAEDSDGRTMLASFKPPPPLFFFSNKHTVASAFPCQHVQLYATHHTTLHLFSAHRAEKAWHHGYTSCTRTPLLQMVKEENFLMTLPTSSALIWLPA